MGQYANVTSKRMYQFLKWLGNKKEIIIVVGGVHPIKVTCQINGKSYPLPIGHRMVNKYIVKAFMEWLVQNEVCTQEEFDKRI